MSALAASILVAVATAVLGVITGYFTARRTLQAEFDTSLRDLRLAAYKTLWRELGGLAKYDRPESLTKDDAQAMLTSLRVWYFETGGFYLSHRTRQDYFALLDGLERVSAAEKKRLADDDDEFLRVLGSRLRTGLTADVGTRRHYPFRPESANIARESRIFTDGTRELVVSRGRRRYLAFGPRRPELRFSGDPHPRWDPGRQAFTVRIPGRDGAVEEREFLLESNRLVEGPKGWHRDADATSRRQRGVVWREGRAVPSDETKS
jgi:hypothetical protein